MYMLLFGVRATFRLLVYSVEQLIKKKIVSNRCSFTVNGTKRGCTCMKWIVRNISEEVICSFSL